MADLTLKERLQPSLLDRLTDREPDKKRESRDRRVLSVEKLRESVVRDLSWLLNTGALSMTDDLSAFPEAEKSVINYGAPDLAGVTLSDTNTAELEKALREAIINFEPRLLPDKLKIRVDTDQNKMSRGSLTFHIEGELWAQPMPLNLYLRTDLDLETGNYTVSPGSR